MKTYINTQQVQIPSYNLEVASNAFNKLNEGHIQAIQAQSELQNAIAQLDLNEAEDDFRQQLVNEIDSTVKENTRYNNAYFALPDIIAKAGNINSNPELIGRLRAQQAYKANIDAIDARTDVNDAAKEMAKAMSPYYYRDKETGELINNGIWKPGYSPVKSYDINEILQLVGQYVSPDKGGFSAPISFLNVDGSISDHWNPAGGMGVLNQQTGQWERLSEDKIKQAWNAAIAANPGIIASLKQDYEVANWNIDTKGEDIYNIIGQDGSRITFNDFVNRIINPYAKAKSYNNITSSIEYQSATINAYQNYKLKQQELALKYVTQQEAPDITIGSPGDNVEIENDIIRTTSQKITDYNTNFRASVANILQGTNYAVDLNALDLNNREQTINTLTNAGIPVEEINNIMLTFDKYEKLTYADRLYMDTIYNEMDDRGKSARKISDDMILGNSIDKNYFEDNDSYQRWTKMNGKIIDTAFSKGNIYFRTFNSEEADDLITALGGRDTMKRLGYNIIKQNGKIYIGLDKDNSNQFYRFSREIQNIRTNRNFGTNFINTVSFSGTSADSYYLDENGKIHEYVPGNPRGINYVSSIFRVGDNFLSRMERIGERKTPDDLSTMIVESDITPGGTIEESNARRTLAYTNDKDLITINNARLKAWDGELRTAFATKGIINTKVRLISDDRKDSNGSFVYANSKDVAKLTEALQNTDTVKDIQFSIMSLPTGDVYTVATVPVGTGKDRSSYKILVEDINSPQTDAYKRGRNISQIGTMYKASKSNKPEQVLYYTDDLGETQYIVLYPTQTGDNSFYIGYNGEPDISKVISFKDAARLKEIYNFLINPSVLDGYSREEYERKATEYLNDFQTYYGNIITLPNYASTDLQPIIDEIIR